VGCGVSNGFTFVGVFGSKTFNGSRGDFGVGHSESCSVLLFSLFFVFLNRFCCSSSGPTPDRRQNPTLPRQKHGVESDSCSWDYRIVDQTRACIDDL